jgi:phage terminase large subunit-like protein
MWIRLCTSAHEGFLEGALQTFDELRPRLEASGKPVAQMLRNWNRHSVSYAVRPAGHKVARALSVRPLLDTGVIYAAVRDWSEILINQASSFPKAKHDDIVDSMTPALKFDATLAWRRMMKRSSRRRTRG